MCLCRLSTIKVDVHRIYIASRYIFMYLVFAWFHTIFHVRTCSSYDASPLSLYIACIKYIFCFVFLFDESNGIYNIWMAQNKNYKFQTGSLLLYNIKSGSFRVLYEFWFSFEKIVFHVVSHKIEFHVAFQWKSLFHVLK